MSSPQRTDFGPNEWLVHEIYEQYLADPASVDPAWHDFFADYRPGDDDAPAAEVVNGAGPATATTPKAPSTSRPGVSCTTFRSSATSW